MDCIKIPFSKTGTFSKTFLDYINGEHTLKSFYHRTPAIESFEEQITEKQAYFTTEKRHKLADTLLEQYAHLSEVPSTQIERLRDEKTFTVTTGHQLNIFSGPLYFIYKVASTIQLAEQLKRVYPEYHFVPVYWMATEDHDFEEISFFNAFGRKYQWNKAKVSGAVGRLSPTGLQDILDQIQDMPSFFKEAYTTQENLTDATRYFVHQLFGEYGLLCVDGDSRALKQEIVPLIEKDVLEHIPYAHIQQTDQQLEEAGYGTQIYSRSINFFYLDGSVRERIEEVEGQFQVLNTDLSFSKEEMQFLIEQHPERFSPNVALRPVYQEAILPNLSYAGGPAEVVYWLQLKASFAALEVPFPILLPRGFALLLEEKHFDKLKYYGFEVEDLFRSEVALKKLFTEKHAAHDYTLEEEFEVLEKLYEQVLQKTLPIDQGLEKHVKAELKRAQDRLKHTAYKLEKSERRNLSEGLERVLAIKEEAFPGGVPQERKTNMMHYFVKYPNMIYNLLELFKEPLEFVFYIGKL
ncbi:bacillithiol biosynthesis cysteine-adding enzyme BshC [Algivirga pacifica]|uniref:Putative cysteine ligase BshC n=1 Tax=Algivirga pacifica TaxID=1162670 RepID=A0ABP9D8M5_9BACT